MTSLRKISPSGDAATDVITDTSTDVRLVSFKCITFALCMCSLCSSYINEKNSNGGVLCQNGKLL